MSQMKNMVANKEKIIDALDAMGIGREEAKTYLLLIKLGQGMVGKLSSLTGYSRTKVYSILNKLQIEGMVEVTSDKPKMYAPRPLNEIIDEKKQTLSNALDVAEKELGNYYLAFQSKQSRMVSYRGWDVLKKVDEMILGVKESVKIVMAFMPEEAIGKVISLLSTLKQENVKVKAIVSNHLINNIKNEAILKDIEIKTRNIPFAGLLIVDNAEAMFGCIEPESREQINAMIAFWTENTELAQFASLVFDQMFESD